MTLPYVIQNQVYHHPEDHAAQVPLPATFVLPLRHFRNILRRHQPPLSLPPQLRPGAGFLRRFPSACSRAADHSARAATPLPYGRFPRVAISLR